MMSIAYLELLMSFHHSLSIPFLSPIIAIFSEASQLLPIKKKKWTTWKKYMLREYMF